MFTMKPWIETATRALLILVVVFDALAPTTAIALSVPEDEQAETSLIPR
jgi:hypothetical protein